MAGWLAGVSIGWQAAAIEKQEWKAAWLSLGQSGCVNSYAGWIGRALYKLSLELAINSKSSRKCLDWGFSGIPRPYLGNGSKSVPTGRATLILLTPHGAQGSDANKLQGSFWVTLQKVSEPFQH